MKKNIFCTDFPVNKRFTCLIEICLLLAIISVSSIFTSCVTVKKLPGLEKIYVTNTKQINLLPTECITTPVESIMQLNIAFEEKSFSVLTYIQADENILFMELMNDFMISMGTLEYDGSSINFDCAVFPSSLKPEYIINDFQNAYYSSAELKKNLNASHLIFEEETTGEITKRSIKDNSKLVEEITISPESVTIKNYLRSYEYTLFSAE